MQSALKIDNAISWWGLVNIVIVQDIMNKIVRTSASARRIYDKRGGAVKTM